MSRELTTTMQTQVAAPVLRPILLAELSFASGYVRAWTGLGPLVWDGNTYLGTGAFGGVSPVTEAMDIRSTNVSFSISGIPSDLLALFLGDHYQGRPAKLWFATVDENCSVIADPFLLFAGLMDTCSIVDNGPTSSISISAENRLVDLTKPRTRRFTDGDQRSVYPDDLGLSSIAALQNQEITFGKRVASGDPGGAVTGGGGGNTSGGRVGVN